MREGGREERKGKREFKDPISERERERAGRGGEGVFKGTLRFCLHLVGLPPEMKPFSSPPPPL
jgi:hypothetical protein